MVAISTLLLAGDQAVSYTKSKLRWSYTRFSDVVFSGGTSIFTISDARDYEDQLLEETKRKHGEAKVNCLVALACRAKAAETYGAGNCGENAAVAFIWLYLNRPLIRPLDYCNQPSGDHGCVVLGSPIAPLIGNHEEWWTEAVVCDPFHNFAFSGRVALLSRYGTTKVQTLCRVETDVAAGDTIAQLVMGSCAAKRTPRERR